MANQIISSRKLIILFFISGFAALVYQIVWFKYLGYFIGNSSYAQAIVLATFMCGLAAGSYWVGKRSDSVKSPLLLFGALEFLVGIYCLAFPLIIFLVQKLFFSTVGFIGLETDGTAILFLKVVICIFSILIPSVLLGGTLPVVIKAVTNKINESGQKIGLFYSVNSLGAVFGCFFAGFYLIELIGLKYTIFTAAFLDIIIGLYVIIIFEKTTIRKALDSLKITTPSIKPFVEPLKDINLKVYGIIAFLTGASAMIFEIIWVRLLIPVIGSTTYSFTIMLITFITGIAVGSYIFSRITQNVKNEIKLLIFCQFGIVIFLFITLPIYSRLPYYFLILANYFPREYSYFNLYLFSQLAICFSVILIPTILMGISLPALIKTAVKDIKVLGNNTGFIYSLNTLGAVVGSLVAGFFLIPYLGIKMTVDFGIAIYFLIGFFFILRFFSFKNTFSISFIIAILASGIFYNAFFSKWNYSIMLSEVPRLIITNHTAPDSFQAFLEKITPDELLFYKEGKGGTVAVTKVNNELILFTNGKGDSNSSKDMPTQILLGQIPMLLHAQPDTVLVIGLGSGATVGSILTHPIKYVECAEISSEVITASAFFKDYNNNFISDPRLKLVADDGLSVLKLSRKKYDVIVNQPSNPYTSGVGSLFTKEFFLECEKRLNKNGIIAQWFNLYEMDEETLKMVFRTFSEVFPHYSVWQPRSGNIVIIGSILPLKFNPKLIKEKFEINSVKLELNKVNIEDAPSFLSIQSNIGFNLRNYVGSGKINTEDTPYLESWAPRAFFVNKGVNQFRSIDERFKLKNDLFLSIYEMLFPLTAEEELNVAKLNMLPDRGDFDLAYLRLKKFLEKDEDNITALSLICEVLEKSNLENEIKYYRNRLMSLTKDNVEDIDFYVNRGVARAKENQIAEALKDFDKALELDPNYIPALQNKAYTFLYVGDFPRATEIYIKLTIINPLLPENYYYAGYCYSNQEMHQQASKLFKKAIDLNFAYVPALVGLATSLSEIGDQENAEVYASKAINFKPDLAEAYYIRGLIRFKKNNKQLACEDMKVALRYRNDPRVIAFIQSNCKNR
jgi:spermidine synthase